MAFGLAKVRDGDGSIGVDEEIASLTNDVRRSTRLGFEKTFHLDPHDPYRRLGIILL